MPDKSRTHTQIQARILQRAFPGICSLDEPLAAHTSYRVGGPADVLIVPDTIEQLQRVVQICAELDLPWIILGDGANILVHDEGIAGAVLFLHTCCDQLFHEQNTLYAGSGVTVQELVEYCEWHSLKGLDFMSGIPGTIGGALRMNAGAFVGEIGDRVTFVDVLDRAGNLLQISKADAGFGYRKAEGLANMILLGCRMEMESGDRTQLTLSRTDYLQRRADMQPLEFPSCGSVFKRPPGDYAGRLIQAAGGKGFRIGGAMVSKKHANFVVNTNQASAQDIYDVISGTQQRVFEQFGVWLQLEVKLLGFPDEDLRRVEGPYHGS